MGTQNIQDSASARLSSASPASGLGRFAALMCLACGATSLLTAGAAANIRLLILGILPVAGLLWLYLGQRKKLAQLEQALAMAKSEKAEAETAAREKSRVLATMSHEIRTPLNGVIGMLALLNDSTLSAQQRNYSATAHSSARTLLSIIDEVLDTARSESRRKQPREKVDVVSFVEGIMELLAPRAHSKGIEVSARVAPDVPKEIMVDELHLRQVLFNLAGNAIKFTDKGGVAIEVSMASDLSLAFKVLDSGIGMTKEEAAKVFDAFTQANTTTQARFGGTGLGLSISRDLVSGMGGKLDLETAPGKGSTFTITLPMEKQPRDVQQFWEPLNRRHYVLALPEGFARDHLAATLGELGAEVSYVKDSRELAAEMANASLLKQFICGTEHAQALAKWAKRKTANAEAVVWIMLKPEERHAHAALLKAPFAGYLLSPLRRGTLLAQLSSHDGRSLKQAGVAMRKGKTKLHKASKMAAAKPTGLAILLAEDNPINALLTRTILEKNGHSVRVVGDGGEALDLLRSDWRCDLAVMDVEMPWVSGIKVAELLRKDEGLAHRRDLPLLAMTGNVRPEDVKACLDAGFNQHLPKPFDKLDLEEKVAGMMALAKAA